jgi:carbon monoxide dehydrogenase subunit G
MARFEISHSIEIDRSAATVYRYVTDLSQVTAWRPSVSRIEYDEDAPFGVGTIWHEITTFLGRDIVAHQEIAAVDVDRGFTIKQDAGGFTGYATWTFTPSGDNNCVASLNFEGELSGWFATLAAGLLTSQGKKRLTRDFANLKANAESQ